MYTWIDTSLREISEYVQREVEGARKRDTQMEFSLLYPDFNGSLRRKHLGSVYVGSKGPDDLKTLNQLRFMIGDFLCLIIQEPKPQQMQESKKNQFSEFRRKREDELEEPN